MLDYESFPQQYFKTVLFNNPITEGIILALLTASLKAESEEKCIFHDRVEFLSA
jgi:hypothetical protein